MARVDVLMPQMGESIAEGTLSKWLKKLGDEVKRDEPLFEISTDKVDAEIPAPSAGVLAEIKVQEGQTVPVQTLVAVIETDKGAAATAAPATAASPAAPPVAAAQRAPAAPGGTAVSPPPTSPAPPRPSPSSPVLPTRDGAELRRKHKAAYAERGVNLTYLAFIAKTCAENLRTHPVVNAAVSGDNIIYRRDVNIGIAVALEWGLIVPVVKRADELSLAGLARTINDLGERARTKKLLPDEIQRGTFTITNPGVFGSYAGAPIINQPQVAILGVGAIEKRPKVVTLADGTDTIAIRTMGMVSMSYDHRVVDGADADRFLADVKRTLENFPDGAI